MSIQRNDGRVSKLFTQEHISFLRNNAGTMPDYKLINLFNRHFGMNANKGTVRSLMYRRGILKQGAKFKTLTPEQSQFLESNAPLYTLEKLTESFNSVFNTDYTKEKMRNFLKHRKIKIGIPFLPVGSEWTNGRGFVFVKTEKKWVRKHYIIWESVHGKIPKGHYVIFADRNKNNFEIKNLVLVKKNELCSLIRNDYLTTDQEITLTGVAITRLGITINERLKGEK